MKSIGKCWLVLVLVLFSQLSLADPLSLKDQLPIEKLTVGAERFSAYLPILEGKKVGLVVNQTSNVKSTHLVDALVQRNIDINYIFAPEHGFRGDQDAGAHINSSVDPKTGIPIISIYGKNKKPTAEQMQQLDVVIFDIQDVGARFYTYISSMHYVMEAAAENDVQFIVLDRPNPNIQYIDGPILDDKFRSFVGLHPIPVLHGMTVGELAKMINAEGWLANEMKVDLTVIPVANYQRTDSYSLPIKPSPNLPNDQAIQLYPSLCFFEATAMSIGRGTAFPFQVLGHNEVHLGDFEFMPVSTPGAALYPKLENQQLQGIDLRNSKIHGLDLTLLIKAYSAFKQHNKRFFTHQDFMDKLAGTDELRKAIEAGQTASQIKASWQDGLSQFMQARKPYLIYQ